MKFKNGGDTKKHKKAKNQKHEKKSIETWQTKPSLDKTEEKKIQKFITLLLIFKKIPIDQ